MNAPGIIAACRAAIRPDPMLDPDDWADMHYRLTTGESSKPGRWETRAYQREPLKHLSAYSRTRRVVLMLPAQVSGKSQIGIIWAAYTAHSSPSPMLIVQPREADAEDMSKRRLAPMTRLPCMAGVFADPKAKSTGNTILAKEFPGGSILLIASNSPAGFRGKPIGRLWFDEPDGYPPSAGTEGDPVRLGRARLSSWGPRGKELITCTPTVTGRSRIESEYNASSKGRLHVACPRCRGYFEPAWAHLQWAGDPADPAAFGAWLECPACGGRIEEHEKTRLVQSSRWVHERPELVDDVWGGQMTAIVTPYGSLEWRTLVEEWVYAQARARVGDLEPLKTFTNVRMAQTFEDRGEVVTAEGLASRIEPQWQDLPARVRCLTAGVDTHNDRLEASIYGWGPGMEAWLVAHIAVHGDPISPDTFRALDDAVLTPSWLREDGQRLKVTSACIDAGGQRTQAVLEYAAKRARQGVVAIRGVSHHGSPIWNPKASTSKVYATAGKFFLVGREDSGDRIQAMQRTREPGPNYLHVGEGTPRYWFDEMTAQRRVRTVSQVGRNRGREQWHYEPVTIGADDHAWDCARYALAAMHRLLARGAKLGKPEPRTESAAMAQDAATPAPPPAAAVDNAGETAQPTTGAPTRQRRPKRREITADDWWRAQR